MRKREFEQVSVIEGGCPRGHGMPRIAGLGAEDHWQRGRWCRTEEELATEIKDLESRDVIHSGRAMLWQEGEEPRTCSYCGGIHPDDAIALIKKGWHVGVTDKPYKRYLEPRAGLPSPVPPVKVYTQHFDEEQVKAFNAALLDQHYPTPEETTDG